MPCQNCGLPITRAEAGPSAQLCQCEAPEYTEPTTGMAPAPATLITAPRRPLGLLPAPDTPLTLCPHNFPVSTFAGKAMLLKASGPGDMDVEPGKPLCFRAVYWALIPGEAVNEETGETENVVRTILMTRDGKTFRSASAHLPSRILAASMMFSAEEWADGIPLIVEMRKGRRGRMYHDVNVDVQPEQKKKGK